MYHYDDVTSHSHNLCILRWDTKPSSVLSMYLNYSKRCDTENPLAGDRTRAHESSRYIITSQTAYHHSGKVKHQHPPD